MRVFKTKWFRKWSTREGLSDEALKKAVKEMEQGLVDAELGGNVYKKRIGLRSRGKSGGVRTLLAFKTGRRAFFIYGFTKNERANIDQDELNALKAYAGVLLEYSNLALEKAIEKKILFEVNNNGW